VPTGIGTAPIGLSVSGYGGVDHAPVLLQTILINAASGDAMQARKIDPVTGQYVYNEDDQVEGMSGVQQLVLMRVATLLNSSAVRGLGVGAPAGVISQSTEMRLADEIRVALRDIVDARLIQVVSISYQKHPTSSLVYRSLRWRDLTTNNEQETKF
jgi:hypothetical protein